MLKLLFSDLINFRFQPVKILGGCACRYQGVPVLVGIVKVKGYQAGQWGMFKIHCPEIRVA